MRRRPFSGHFLYCLAIGKLDRIQVFALSVQVSPGCVAEFCAMFKNVLCSGFRVTLNLCFCLENNRCLIWYYNNAVTRYSVSVNHSQLRESLFYYCSCSCYC